MRSIVSGAERMRFERFSSCNGVYVRLDMSKLLMADLSWVLNVDFNEPMVRHFKCNSKMKKVTLAVGQHDVQVLITTKPEVVEKK
jgi:hypothetical protein